MGSKKNPPKEYCREPVGRPTKFTSERCASIIDAVSHRIPYKLAAESNGICMDTLYEWFKIGRKHNEENIESEYSLFSEALKRAEMQRVRKHTDNISERPERWQADAWILERRWHMYFGPNAQLNELNERLNKVENGDSKNGNEKE
jgi:hypothetical protein